MNGYLEWAASIGTIIAATLVAIDLSRKITGWGFVLFCVVASLWVISGWSDGAMPIVVMNALLFVINAWGVWRYLVRKTPDISAGETGSHGSGGDDQSKQM